MRSSVPLNGGVLAVTFLLSARLTVPLGTIGMGRGLPSGFSTFVPGGESLGVPANEGFGSLTGSGTVSPAWEFAPSAPAQARHRTRIRHPANSRMLLFRNS